MVDSKAVGYWSPGMAGGKVTMSHDDDNACPFDLSRRSDPVQCWLLLDWKLI